MIVYRFISGLAVELRWDTAWAAPALTDYRRLGVGIIESFWGQRNRTISLATRKSHPILKIRKRSLVRMTPLICWRGALGVYARARHLNMQESDSS
jgi:hypothetical protein